MQIGFFCSLRKEAASWAFLHEDDVEPRAEAASAWKEEDERRDFTARQAALMSVGARARGKQGGQGSHGICLGWRGRPHACAALRAHTLPYLAACMRRCARAGTPLFCALRWVSVHCQRHHAAALCRRTS